MESKVVKFEDLIAWQKARELTRKIYQISRTGEVAKDFRLSGQIQSAAVSIMSNIAEGFERGGLVEFRQFLSTAKASCAEFRSQLYVALDVGYIDARMVQDLRGPRRRGRQNHRGTAGINSKTKTKQGKVNFTQYSGLIAQD
jgi:four helix bundle protein